MATTSVRVGTLLAAALLLAGIVAPPAAAGTFTVNDTGDAGEGSCDPEPGTCTLREAVLAANAVAGHDTIELPAAATITLDLEGAEQQDGTVYDLDVTDDLTVLGNGATITTHFRDVGSDTRVIDVPGGPVDLSLEDLTITGAAVSDASGGAVEYGGSGQLSLTGVTLTGNQATGFDGHGGSLSVTPPARLFAGDTQRADAQSTTVAIVSSILSDSRAGGFGGAAASPAAVWPCTRTPAAAATCA